LDAMTLLCTGGRVREEGKGGQSARQHEEDAAATSRVPKAEALEGDIVSYSPRYTQIRYQEYLIKVMRQI
jgi:hypothetical protein